MTLRVVRLTLMLGAFAPFATVTAPQHGTRAPDTIIDLGTLGHDVSVAVAVNNKTQVIGWITDNFESFRAPFLWEDGVMRVLMAESGLQPLNAQDINDRGQIVGSGVDVRTFASVALLWQDGTPTRLPTPAGDVHCAAEAINDRGDVVGSCATPDGDGIRWHGVLWRDGAIVDLGTLPGGGDMFPLAISHRGIVVGALRTPEGLPDGSFGWEDGVLTRLPPGFSAVDINDRGQIAGTGRPAIWLQAMILDRGTIVRLPSLSDSVHCVAEAINQRGDVGGSCAIGAAIWVHRQPLALPGLSEFTTTATDLNDRGDVVGYSISPSPDNNAHAVLWPGAAKRPPAGVER